MVKHNSVIPRSHFRKYCQNYVRTWFNHPARKTCRRNAFLPPVVRNHTVKFNMKVKSETGFTHDELKTAGILRNLAPTVGISVDHHRKNRSLEGFQANMQRLKEYKAKMVVYPRRILKFKAGDSTPEELAKFTGRLS